MEREKRIIRVVVLIGNIDSQTLHTKTRNLVIGDFKVQSTHNNHSQVNKVNEVNEVTEVNEVNEVSQ